MNLGLGLGLTGQRGGPPSGEGPADGDGLLLDNSDTDFLLLDDGDDFLLLD